MSEMFWGCSSLQSIDLSSFNTTNVKDMSEMFRWCSSLQSIDLSSFKTTNIKVKFIFNKLLTSTCWMFYECSSLQSIDLSSFNTFHIFNISSIK